MKIASYNVNGIRAANKKGLTDWILANDLDIVCIQETKAQPEQVDLSELHSAGYQTEWYSAQKKGYSGVLTITKASPKQVRVGTGYQHHDDEGRTIITEFDTFTLINSYFPSGTSGDERQAFKMAYLDEKMKWLEEERKRQPNLIIVGDFNIAHHPIDIHDPVGNKKSSGFLPEEREWLSEFERQGWTDAFRWLNPDQVEYSWWTYRHNARANNKGWRIDYQWVTEPLKDRIVSAYHDGEAVHSDHCPVVVDYDI